MALHKDKVILLAEDNPDDEELIRLAFEQHNITNLLIVVRDGEEAINYLFGSEASTLPQVIILDLKLPKIDGFQILERVRADKRTHCIPVVILTSSREKEDLVRAYELGTNAYVRKPIDFIQFANAVKQLGMFWLLLNELPTEQDSSCLSYTHSGIE